MIQLIGRSANLMAVPTMGEPHAPVSLISGVALGLGATALYGLGSRDHQKIEDSRDDPGSLSYAQAAKLRDSGTSKKQLGYLSWGLGGAAILPSAVLFAIESRGGEKPKSRAGPGHIQASPITAGGMVSVGGSF